MKPIALCSKGGYAHYVAKKKRVPAEAREIFREAYRSAAGEVQEFFREAGRVGGLTSSKMMTAEQRTARAKKAAAASAKVRSAALRKQGT